MDEVNKEQVVPSDSGLGTCTKTSSTLTSTSGLAFDDCEATSSWKHSHSECVPGSSKLLSEDFFKLTKKDEVVMAPQMNSNGQYFQNVVIGVCPSIPPKTVPFGELAVFYIVDVIFKKLD